MTLGRFSAIFIRELTIVTSCLRSCTQKPLLEKGLLKKGRICSGSKFFPFIVDPFKKGGQS